MGEPQQRERIEVRVSGKAVTVELEEGTVLGRASRVVDQEVDRLLVGLETCLDRGERRLISQVGGEDLDLDAVPGGELRRQPLERVSSRCPRHARP
jgi:hypothetical protein